MLNHLFAVTARHAASAAPFSRATRIAVMVAVVVAAVSLAAADVSRADIYDPNATPSWEALIDGPASGDDVGLDLAIAGDTVYACGYAVRGGAGVDASFIRLDYGAAPSALHTYDGAWHLTDTASDIALDPRGSHLYTAGQTTRTGLLPDLLVVRWRRSGQVDWARSYRGPAGGQDAATDVGVDRRGNVTACGTSAGSHGNDWVVVSWNPSGALRWVWRYSGSGRLDDRAEELYVDRAGNVFVTGSARLTGDLPASVTVKLSPRGRRLWTRTYTGPDRLGAETRAITRCPSGGVYVGGWVERTGSGRDALVVRYAADGSRRVGEIHPTPVEPSDEALVDLAVAAGGVVVGAGWHEIGAGPKRRLDSRWDTAGEWQGTSLELSTWDETWTGVATDAFGGYYLTGVRATSAVTFEIVTTRRSLYPHGAYWAYAWAGPMPAANVAAAIAARGTLVAAVGSGRSATTGWNQVVLEWKY